LPGGQVSASRPAADVVWGRCDGISKRTRVSGGWHLNTENAQLETSNELRAGGVIIARTDSQRLPGKMLRVIAGRPLLEWVVRRAQAAEALIVDARGFVLEGATSNVFVVTNGELWTPPESAGILAGITRAHLLEAAKTLGIPVRLEELPEQAIFDADEVFISSSIREVLPVVRVNEQTIRDGTPGVVTRRLHSAFRKAAGAPGPDPWV